MTAEAHRTRMGKIRTRRKNRAEEQQEEER
jgi:hypothetical protein